jgi:type IV secretory pathway VirB6-like protein
VPVRRSINDTITRDRAHDGGETVREFDLRSAAIVLGAAIGAGFLVFYVLAFVPWLLANGMTAAVEGMMNQIGFDNFNASTLGDWILVLLVGAVFTAFIVGIVTTILWLYNLLSERTGMGFRLAGELPAGDEPAAIEATPERAVPARRAGTAKRAAATKSASTKRSTAKRTTAKRTTKKSAGTTKRRR